MHDAKFGTVRLYAYPFRSACAVYTSRSPINWNCSRQCAFYALDTLNSHCCSLCFQFVIDARCRCPLFLCDNFIFRCKLFNFNAYVYECSSVDENTIHTAVMQPNIFLTQFILQTIHGIGHSSLTHNDNRFSNAVQFASRSFVLLSTNPPRSVDDCYALAFCYIYFVTVGR